LAYWQDLLRRQTSRRKVIVGGAGLAGAAALLAACGGGDDGGSEGPARTGLGTKIYDDTSEETPVKRGGTLPGDLSGDMPSLDPYRQIAGTVQGTIGGSIYTRLMRYKSGPGIDPGLAESEPDTASGYEVADGGLTYIFKIKPGVKFQNVAPVSGRELDAEDVAASYARFSTMGSPQFGSSFKDRVVSVTAPDKQTVVWKLTAVNAGFLPLVTHGQFLWLMPKEMGVSVDPLEKPIGAGPWVLSNYVPSSRLEFEKHPQYFQQGLPYMDRRELYIIPENSQRLAQFQAENLWDISSTIVQPAEFRGLAEGKENIRILKGDFTTSMGGGAFGRGDPNSPFLKDDRLRKAVSLAIDRDTIVETINDLDFWREMGLEREYRHNNYVPAGLKRWWVDPRGPEMGSEAQWFQFDPQKAKQLVSAAGFPDGLETELHYSSNQYPQAYRNTVLIIADMLPAAGIKANPVGDDYGSVFNIRGWAGELPGMAWGIPTGFDQPELYLDYLFGRNSTRNQMRVFDETFYAMVDAQQQELDENKRKQLIIDIFRYQADKMRFVPFGYGAVTNFELSYNFYKNTWAYRPALAGFGTATEALTHRWSDRTA
jgi:peptide/nickel transport system substrate-binding protein